MSDEHEMKEAKKLAEKISVDGRSLWREPSEG